MNDVKSKFTKILNLKLRKPSKIWIFQLVYIDWNFPKWGGVDPSCFWDVSNMEAISLSGWKGS